MFNNSYKNKKILITGHTGFKGSWLAFWLSQMGADVLGYSLAPNTTPNHFSMLDLSIESVIGDILDREKLFDIFKAFQPEVVFHLAAQPLVRQSYNEPVETLQTNIIGTANVLDACRKEYSVKAVINITSDKCYENKEWPWGYRENDPMGGYDPYSVSKGCSELVTSAYRNSYFNPDEYGKKHNTLLASVRAGNVIGGGDWAKERIITDLMEAVSKGKKLIIRNPGATRPWQHVLEPLYGYLLLGNKLLEGKNEFAEAWNFGPNDDGAISVLQMVQEMGKFWGKIDYEIEQNKNNPHEANLLKLDCAKARSKLNWKSLWDSSITFAKTVEWYKCYYENQQVVTESQLKEYIDARILHG
ncbi:MAG: CDP-glucose 4,6-dehydratase [Desulfobacterales bacterium]|nr:CDP-glucose 4,6-dehydratase [Desulfobacterales bacterium]